jgi:hypothetical protein
MNALRQFVNSDNGILSIQLPVEYHRKNLEVIILPVENDTVSLKINTHQLAQAHLIIDAGISIENTADFLADFEESRQDRTLPFRD